jgi:coenzyme F420-0:L-glutamate ligase/coenzyme F420-1:gamma-L-glutamate ligase
MKLKRFADFASGWDTCTTLSLAMRGRLLITGYDDSHGRSPRMAMLFHNRAAAGRVDGLEVIPVGGLPEVEPGADLPALILRALGRLHLRLRDRDVIVVKQKVVSKAEGRLVKLDEVEPGPSALRLAAEQRKDPRLVELILREATRVVRAGHGVIITETRQGLVCANSGVDKSNVKDGYVALLPVEPDRSARLIRKGLETKTNKRVAVVITDTFGRPWRRGQTDVAIGCSGISPLFSYRGKTDKFGYALRVTEPAVVDEIAAAAELVTGKLTETPVALVRGAKYERGEGGVRAMLMEKGKDLFR